MRFRMIFSFILLMVASSVLADSGMRYKEIKRILQELKHQEEAPNFIRPEKRNLPLCGSCPRVSVPAKNACATSLAPEFGPIAKDGGCVCLKSYFCCPKRCPSIPSDACSVNTTGNSYTQTGTDCCDCPTVTCVSCPPPLSQSSATCDTCYHYEPHHTQQNETQCWESGCKRNKPIVYTEPDCDTNCRMISTVKDHCDSDKKICEDKSEPIDCKPAMPKWEQCYLSPKQVFLDRYYSEKGVCKKCWKWELTQKAEQCSQIFSLGDSCPAAHKRITGVTTCNSSRDICLPCKDTKPDCTQCEEIVSVKDGCGYSVDTCVMKKCPSNSQWAGKYCGNFKVVKDACGCEQIECVAQIRLAGTGSTSSGGRVEVLRHGSWGTVCSHYFNNRNNNGATVVCKMLGFTHGTYRTVQYKYGNGHGTIWLDDVVCAGHESSIFECSHRPWGQHNCGHSGDAAVECTN